MKTQYMYSSALPTGYKFGEGRAPFGEVGGTPNALEDPEPDGCKRQAQALARCQGKSQYVKAGSLSKLPLVANAMSSIFCASLIAPAQLKYHYPRGFYAS